MTDLRINQIKLRIYPPVKWGQVLIAVVLVYGLLTAALVVTP